jgi:hypothetical protein
MYGGGMGAQKQQVAEQEREREMKVAVRWYRDSEAAIHTTVCEVPEQRMRTSVRQAVLATCGVDARELVIWDVQPVQEAGA